MRRKHVITLQTADIIALVVVASIVFALYFMWLDNYRITHPDIIEVTTATYVEEQPLDGVLLWDEQLVYAPRDGVLTYPSPSPRFVAKGEIIAALDGTAVYASSPAYFYPALDGQEGNWLYSRLWPGSSPFPFFNPAVLMENGIQLRKGAPIGKLVPQPQQLRCIAYLDKTKSLERMLNTNSAFVRIRTEPNGKISRAEVTAVMYAGQKIKVCLRLSFFPPSLLRTREFKASVVEWNQRGVMIPDSAVVMHDTRNVVFVLKGTRVFATEVDGFPTGENQFFITRGVDPGNRVVLNAVNVRDGMTIVW